MTSDQKKLRILSMEPMQLRQPRFEPHFRHPMDPKSIVLRELYDLQKVAGTGTDFERARRIKTWTRERWDHGWDQTDEKCALDLLRGAENGRRYCCAHYSRAFVECCLAIGLPAREMVGARQNVDYPDGIDNNAGHSVSEVYCRELDKWVMFDADLNTYYEQFGEPIGCMELHRAWHADRGQHVHRVIDKPGFVAPASAPFSTPAELRKIWRDFEANKTVDFFYHVAILLPHTVERPIKGSCMEYLWFTGIQPPLAAFLYEGIDLDRNFFVTAEEDFNWPLDQTALNAACPPGAAASSLELRLVHSMPFFSHFELSLNHNPFTRVEGDRLLIELPEGMNHVTARCVDCFGLPGHPAVANLRVNSQSRTRKSHRRQEVVA